MDLTSDHPYWPIKNGLIASYPPIECDAECDIAIVGAGITGSMIAQRLSEMGWSVIVLDGRDVCMGSTSASTSLLQYDIDLPLIELAERIGLEAASRAYRLSHQSVDDLEQLVQRLDIQCDFQRRTSIYLADDRRRGVLLANEARARKRLGLDITYLNQEDLRERFGLRGVAALSSQQAAACDGYRLAHALLHHATLHGAQIYDRTQVTRFTASDQGVAFETHRGPIVRARWGIFATGYESQEYLKERVVNLDNTYALVSQPLTQIDGWNEQWMLWEAKVPYLYLRITGDRRLMVGGEDDAFHSPSRRDRRLDQKCSVIEQKVRDLMPALQWETEFKWAGTFGKTKDGLAYIGKTPEYPNCLFALGFGGNGVTFSSIATGLIADWVTGNPSSNGDLFRFDR